MKMPKFRVYASEKVFYVALVEAESLSKLNQMIKTGNVDYGCITDGVGFEVLNIEEVAEND
jgi:hypothetical protein